MTFLQRHADNIYVRLLNLILPFRGWVILSIICMAGYNLFSAAPAYYAKDIVDALAYGEKPELDQFILVGFGIILIFFFKGAFHFGNNYALGHLIQQLLVKLRQRLFDHLLKLSFSFFSASKTGDLTSRFTNDLHTFQNTLHIGVTGPFRDFPQIFILLGLMAYRSWQLALMSLTIIPIALFFIQRFGKRNSKAVSQRQLSFSDMTTLLVESISGIRVVKAFGMEKYESERFEAANEKLYKNQMKSILIGAYSTPIIEVIGATAGATIVAYGGYLIINGAITAGDFTSFILSFFMLNDPVKKLNGFNLKLQEGVASIKRIFEVLDTEPEIVSPPNAHKPTAFEKGIDIQIERFQYPLADEPALKDIHLHVKRGEVVALVGSSGSGKTTLANLIPRFHDVDQGFIKVDGYDLRELDLQALRSMIAVVTQETILFNDSIASNITYGHPDCSRERMMEAAKAANAHKFIMEHPHGYDTLIGEKGVKLSGGQRQRLSIARALVKDAPILILDEATSALDSESEIEVQQAIEHLMENRTTIVIAHRLSTIRHADRICVMEKGAIIETGTHEELLKRGGRYQQLHKLQFRSQLTEFVSPEEARSLAS
jgi:subfamily B ATP-binding cassette protein MsbA